MNENRQIDKKPIDASVGPGEMAPHGRKLPRATHGEVMRGGRRFDPFLVVG
jgi:hypothetical protein